MKIGYCTGMLAKDSYGVGYEMIPALRDFGFDYVDLPMAQMMAMDEVVFEDTVLAALRDSGLPCVCVNNLFPASIPLTGAAADHGKALDYIGRAFSRMQRLGAKRAVFGSSGARNVPLGWAREEGIAQLASLLGGIADIAESYGITVVIEPLNCGESNIIHSLADGTALAQTVSRPQIQVLADYYHMALGGEGAAQVADTRGMLRHVHIARPLGRGLPLPGDGENYSAFFDALRTAGYDGEVSIEARADLPLENIGRSLAYLRTF